MTAVRALCVLSASGHKNRDLPKTTSTESPWSSAGQRQNPFDLRLLTSGGGLFPG